ncbi:HNH endonuclease [Nocardia aobensis]|uniref:HNH endonuclease n=1 Tax=Nocardia aobensis TaxID=257277 RepID=UPI0002E5D087|nr:HNH endonuclease signature motif containing protein [Nocardia aobensis]
MPAWALKSVGEDRDWLSNDGYPDIPGVQYVYTNTVGNHRRVAVGDLVVVHDRDLVDGVSVVDQITAEPDVPVQIKRCPECGKASVGRLKRGPQRFRCDRCSARFDEYVLRDETRTFFTAHIANHWQPIDGALTTERLMTARSNNDRQSSIRPLDEQIIAQLLDAIAVARPDLSETPPVVPAAAPTIIEGGRQLTFARVRKGQNKFRDGLVQRDGLRCAITGRCHPRALEAAHLRRFAEHETHRLDEGLLLRADIHKLFDDGLIAIDPTTMQVVVAPELDTFPDYSALRGIQVKAPEVSKKALTDHYNAAVSSWGLTA